MDLFAIRRHFRSLSGRYDLIDDDPTGLAAFFINSASRYLDRATEHQKTWGVHFEEIAADAFHADIPFCRAVKEVWVSNDQNERYQLEKMDIQDIIRSYLSSTPESGEPLYYSPVITRRIPEGVDISAFSSYLTYTDTQTDLDNDFNAIVIVPPTDASLLVEVRGLYYSKELVNDADENYWTVVHPLTLLKAVMRELEIFNQNKSKTAAWDRALAIEIQNINQDLVEELIAEVDEMEVKTNDFTWNGGDPRVL
jgi:hypothetical protein